MDPNTHPTHTHDDAPDAHHAHETTQETDRVPEDAQEADRACEDALDADLVRQEALEARDAHRAQIEVEIDYLNTLSTDDLFARLDSLPDDYFHDDFGLD